MPSENNQESDNIAEQITFQIPRYRSVLVMQDLAFDAAGIARALAVGGINHPRFGDLSDPGAVVIPAGPVRKYHLQEQSPFFIHLSVTGRCTARCQGCINSAITGIDRGISSSDTDPERDARCILHLLDGYSGEAVVCFYGGEPLLVPEKIVGVWDILQKERPGPQTRAMIYTNGELIGRSVARFPDLMRDTWLHVVSIDGQREQHERVRSGTRLQRIHESLETLKPVRTGLVLMWSTLREEQSLSDCFKEFSRLHALGLVDQFFWHWIEIDEPYEDFGSYLRTYERELNEIMAVYLDWLGQGRVLPIVHLNELILYLLTGKDRGSTACGVELEKNYDLKDGAIHACADLPPQMAIGSIEPSGQPLLNRFDLSRLTTYKKSLGCNQCGVHRYCGGRCPVQAHASKGLRLVQYCQLMRLHVGTVMNRLERIDALLKMHRISLQQIYDQSAFLAPFTDVTP